MKCAFLSTMRALIGLGHVIFPTEIHVEVRCTQCDSTLGQGCFTIRNDRSVAEICQSCEAGRSCGATSLNLAPSLKPNGSKVIVLSRVRRCSEETALLSGELKAYQLVIHIPL